MKIIVTKGGLFYDPQLWITGSPLQSLILQVNQSFHYSIFTLKDTNSIFMLVNLGNGFYNRYSEGFPGEINSI